jgi:hypothetical protein
MKFVSREEWKEAFGETEAEALAHFSKTYPIVLELDGEVLLSIDLKAFDEVLELFDDDPALVDRTIELYPLFRDTSISPDWLMALLDLFEDRLGYSPINPSGYFSLQYEDIRKYYGESFDRDMAERYPSFGRFSEWMA